MENVCTKDAWISDARPRQSFASGKSERNPERAAPKLQKGSATNMLLSTACYRRNLVFAFSKLFLIDYSTRLMFDAA